jgi:lysophospholipase L1-like esterase
MRRSSTLPVLLILLGSAVAACRAASALPADETSSPGSDLDAGVEDMDALASPSSGDEHHGFDARSTSDTSGDAGLSDVVVTDSRVDPPDTSGNDDAARLWASAVLPAFDAATVAHLRDVRALGASRGNRDVVLAKMGDSITASTNFLCDLGDGRYSLGGYAALSATVQAFSATALAGGKNSFNRYSSAATGGWTSADVLGPPSEVENEVDTIHPAYAIVMFGTNDASAQKLGTNMNAIIGQLEAEGTVAVLSTIPTRSDYSGAAELTHAINDTVRSIAGTRHLPLIDLQLALDPLPNGGLGADKVHPSVAGTGTAGDFSTSGLQYGYNVRNLTALQMLDRMRAIR